MKKTLYIVLGLAMALLTASCSGFLKETDKDLIVPRTLEHYRAMLNGEAYLTLVDYYYTDLMTDDVADVPGAKTETKNNFKSLYTWQRNLEMDGNGTVNATLNFSWLRNYRLIAILNYVIEQIDEAEGSETGKMYLKGETLCLRAKCYLELVNLYAKHYDPATADTDLGVPIRLGIGVEDTYDRSTVAQTYAVIEADLAEGIRLMQQSGESRNIWSVSPTSAKLLQSRICLYKKEYQKCIDLATEVIASPGHFLWDLARNPNVPFVSFANPEVLHTWGPTTSVLNSDGITPRVYCSGGDLYEASEELLGVFLPGDARLSISNTLLVTAYLNVKLPSKFSKQFTGLGAFSLRLAEAYLNRAEAYHALGQDDKARADIVAVVSHRVKDMSAVIVPTDSQQLGNFICDERRREFCFEGMRWIDLKRWTDRRQAITHGYTTADNNGNVIGSEYYVLLANDPNYILPIPNDEIDGNNDLIIQNDRYEKRPMKN